MADNKRAMAIAYAVKRKKPMSNINDADDFLTADMEPPVDDFHSLEPDNELLGSAADQLPDIAPQPADKLTSIIANIRRKNR